MKDQNGLSNSSKRSLKISLRSPKRNLKKKPAYTYGKYGEIVYNDSDVHSVLWNSIKENVSIGGFRFFYINKECAGLKAKVLSKFLGEDGQSGNLYNQCLLLNLSFMKK